jgi:hypothetical protein
MPPVPRKNEDITVSDDDSPTYTFSAEGVASLTPTLTAKQAREKLAETETKLHLTIHVILRTGCLMIASIYLLRWIGLFENHFWLAVFLCSCVIEESSPALNNMLQVRMILLHGLTYYFIVFLPKLS